MPPKWSAESRHRLAVAGLIAAAAAVYFYRLGQAPLAASEAYSALAAAQPSVAMVAHSAVSMDPGKPVIYHLLLHWFCRGLGLSEAALRSFSVIFGVISVYLVFALGADLFGFEVGWCAAVLWGSSPLAAILARWARMYSMFIAVALAHILALARARRAPGPGILLLAGVLGAAMLYVHLGAILILGADAMVMAREWRHTGKVPAWPALAISNALFLPALPLTLTQSRALLFGHWLDWLGASRGAGWAGLMAGAALAAPMLWLTFGARTAGPGRERFQQTLIYALAPMLALGAGSLALRPMFEVRYVSPSFAMLGIVAAAWLDWAGARVRNLATAGIGALFLALLPLCYWAPRDPWPRIARRIAAGGNPREPIFFEAGFLTPDAGVRQGGSAGFPQGFFRVPFDYYFHGSNPRAVIPAADPAAARSIIRSRLQEGGGVWLISANRWPDAIAELPRGPHLLIDYAAHFYRISMFHVRLFDPQGNGPGPGAGGKPAP